MHTALKNYAERWEPLSFNDEANMSFGIKQLSIRMLETSLTVLVIVIIALVSLEK